MGFAVREHGITEAREHGIRDYGNKKLGDREHGTTNMRTRN